MKLIRTNWLTACAALGFAVIGSGGCTKAEAGKGRVVGTVTYQGRPVTFGEVIFYSRERGISAIAPIQESGDYVFDTPLDPGDYEVYLRPKPPEPGGSFKDNPNIPTRYRDLSGPGLKYTINAGKNDLVVELTD